MKGRETDMKKTFEKPTLTVERFQMAEELMLNSGWMQYEESGTRSFSTLNGIATGRDNNTRLG